MVIIIGNGKRERFVGLCEGRALRGKAEVRSNGIPIHTLHSHRHFQLQEL